MDKGNKFLILLISLFIINFLNSDNISENSNNDKAATAVFAQETTSGQFSTYTNEKYNITMQYPSDWTKTEVEGKVEDDESITIVTFSKDIYDYKGDVSIYLDANQSMSLEEYLSSSIEVYEELYEDFDFEVVSSNANSGQKLSGHPAYILEYTLEEELVDTGDDIDTKSLEVGAKIGNNYFYVEYFAEDGDDYDESLPIAQKMIDSIKISNAATSPLSQSSQSQQQQPEQQEQTAPQITIPKTNTPPTAMNSSFITIQNNPIDISLEISDIEGDMVDMDIVELPKFGDLAEKDANTYTLTYTPNTNYVGYDSFTFQGKDRHNASSNKATVSITVASLPSSSSSPSPPSPSVPTIGAGNNTDNNNKLTYSIQNGSQTSATSSNLLPSRNTTNTTTIDIPPPSTTATPPEISTNNNQNLNNMNQQQQQQQLVDQIASTISNANNIDKSKVIQSINDLIEPTNAKGGNVIELLKKITEGILNDPSGGIANKIINIAKTK